MSLAINPFHAWFIIFAIIFHMFSVTPPTAPFAAAIAYQNRRCCIFQIHALARSTSRLRKHWNGYERANKYSESIEMAFDVSDLILYFYWSLLFDDETKYNNNTYSYLHLILDRKRAKKKEVKHTTTVFSGTIRVIVSVSETVTKQYERYTYMCNVSSDMQNKSTYTTAFAISAENAVAWLLIDTNQQSGRAISNGRYRLSYPSVPLAPFGSLATHRIIVSAAFYWDDRRHRAIVL